MRIIPHGTPKELLDNVNALIGAIRLAATADSEDRETHLLEIADECVSDICKMYVEAAYK